MLIVPNQKSVVLNLANPERVTNVIPTVKPFTFKGKQLYAVPHKVEEAKVLRNLGIEVPSPIKYYYDFPRGRTDFKPFEAQLETAAFVTLHRRGFILNDMGTGKTLAFLWAWDYLRSVGLAHKLLVSAPLSTLQRAWADEIFRNFPHLTCAMLHGTAAKRRRLLAQDVDVYIVNHDGMQVIAEDLAERPDVDHVLVDECASLRNSGTARWKIHNVVINRQHPRACHGMTGTPIPNSPTDAYAQCKLITPERVPRYFNVFRDLTMKQIAPYKWAPRDNALEVVLNAMQPAVRYTRDQCVDLPPATFVTREVEMTKEQDAAYRQMVSTLYTEIRGGEILAVNEGVKVSKLLQIACGAAYGADHEVFELPAGPRLEVVEETIEEAGTKVLVFVPLTGALNLLAERLSKHWSVAVIQGDTPKGKRDEIFGAFQRLPDPHVLVANPNTMAHGLTLTKASTIVWYAPTTSNEIFDQANHRIIRPGQKHNQLIVMLEGTPIERKIYDRLQSKQKTQGVLLDLVKEGA
jgi:SNF2 family DNA or RNA helicase